MELDENEKPTGRVAVGSADGTAKAADGSGVELRVPEGATDKGVVLT